jgi:hypothetical protein
LSVLVIEPEVAKLTFSQKLSIVTAMAIGLGFIAVARESGAAANRSVRPSSSTWLAIVAGALIVVGFVSHTLTRHLVQIAPMVLALGLLVRRSAFGAAAAAPLFAFWLLIMAAIWLFLLGLARILTGTFSFVEVVLTVIIGAASVMGLASAYREQTRLSFALRLVTVCVFAVLQYAAMWASAQPFVTRR